MVDQGGDLIALPPLESGKATVSPPASSVAGGRRRSLLPASWRLRNWRMRWRLLALVIIPTVTAIVLGGFRIQAAQDTASGFARVDQLAALGGDVTALADAIEDERDLTAGYLADSQAGKTRQADVLLGELGGQYAISGARLAVVQKQSAQIGPAYPAVARTDLAFALSRVTALPDLRGLAHSDMLPLAMATDYSDVISTLLAFDNEIAAGSSSAQLAQTISSLGSLAQAEDQGSQQRALLYAALLGGQFGPGGLSALVAAQSGEASDLATYQTVAGALPAYQPGSGFSGFLSEEQQFNDDVAGPQVDEAQSIENDALIEGGNGLPPSGNAQTWFSDMAVTLGDMRGVETNELASITAQAAALHQGAENSEKLTVVVVLALLVLVLLVTIVMLRSLIMPLRKLRADALDVAGRRLPDVVRKLSESHETDESVRIEPIGVNSTDEIGEVARAFDQVHSEAVRLAVEEALLRLNLNAMFVNLSRRSQSLIERQLSIIDSLEQSEQDPDRLSSLFRLDHLATRMRRNSENLLVLGGHEPPRKWSQPVPLVDVLRAAISEIEQYERIALNVQPGVVISGRVASDVVHLAAELVENATAFSPETTQVAVIAQTLTSGGVLIDITDAGLGIPEQELQYANWRLDNPPVIDVGVSRRMGLFVVGRLAARHGIRVRLRHAHRGGLSALIWLPELVAESEKGSPLGTPRQRFDADGYGPAAPVPAHAQATPGPAWSAGVPTPAMPTPAAPIRKPVTPASPLLVAPASPLPEAPVPATAPAEPEPRAVATATGGTDSNAGMWLPIYDSVESDWFRRSGKTFSGGGHESDSSWTSPADEGFRVAQAAASPAVGDTTAAGLPRRVPSANLVPGSVGPRAHGEQTGQPTGPQQTQQPQQPVSEVPQSRAATPARSAEAVRSRLANLQRGAREGRAAAPWNFGVDEN